MEQQVTINLNDELVKRAQSMLEREGRDLNNVLNDYLKQIIKECFLSEMKKLNGKEKNPSMTMADVSGIFTGMLPTSDDFDDPLDDLKEYME